MATYVKVSNPEQWIGLVIEKEKVICRCASLKPYKTKAGVETFLLIWDCESKISGEKFIQTTGSKSFSIGRLKNHQADKNIMRVALGKKLSARNKEPQPHHKERER